MKRKSIIDTGKPHTGFYSFENIPVLHTEGKVAIIFQRLQSKEEFSGTGMGLAVSKKIIENMGGKVWVESMEGLGSTFYFPIAKTIK